MHDEGLRTSLPAASGARRKAGFAAIHLQRAYRCYQHWGATRKLAQMDAEYGELPPSGRSGA